MYGVAVDAAMLIGCASLVGCASPGPPLPPSLNLPAVVSAGGLTATRVGGEVRLHWTTPTQTTDKLLIKGAVTAEICRDTVASASPAKSTPAGTAKSAAASPAKNAGANAVRPPCKSVAQVAATPGAATDAVDTLPAELAAGPARLLAYRVQLLNAAGRTAGPSPAAYAAAGAAPQPVEDLKADLTKAGVVLRWQARQPGTAGSDWIELERTTLGPPAAAAPAARGGLPGSGKEPTQTRFRAGGEDAGATASGSSTTASGSPDPGGAIDRTAELGHQYSYTAQRVHAETVGGQQLDERSIASAAIELTVRDMFPPEVPQGLVAVPGFEGDKSTLDISWEPDVEPRVAGYRVYRRDADDAAWQRTGPELVTGAAYRDATVTAGHRYAYRVTALSTAGNESGPSTEAAETAATP